MNYFSKIAAMIGVSLLAEQSAAQLQIENPWIALAPPGAAANAAYMQLHNPLSEALTIVGLSADCCAIAILHQMRRDGDKLMMQHLDQLPIAAHETAQLAPGGMHIMLMNSKEPLKHGSRVTITFNLADGRSQSVVLGVKKYEP